MAPKEFSHNLVEFEGFMKDFSRFRFILSFAEGSL